MSQFIQSLIAQCPAGIFHENVSAIYARMLEQARFLGSEFPEQRFVTEFERTKYILHFAERIAAIHEGAPRSFLEVGCGSGFTTKVLHAKIANPQLTLHVMDCDSAAIQHCMMILSSCVDSKDACFHVGDICQTSFEDGFFDACNLQSVVELLDSKQLDVTLRELKRIVLPGAKISIGVSYHQQSFESGLYYNEMRLQPPNPLLPVLFVRDPARYEDVFSKHGFNVQVETIRDYPNYVDDRVNQSDTPYMIYTLSH